MKLDPKVIEALRNRDTRCETWAKMFERLLPILPDLPKQIRREIVALAEMNEKLIVESNTLDSLIGYKRPTSMLQIDTADDNGKRW